MNDFDKMRDNIGNRFDLVLIASERLRELHRERKLKEEYMKVDGFNRDQFFSERKRQEIPVVQVFSDIENSVVGREYLDKIRDRVKVSKVRKNRIL